MVFFIFSSLVTSFSKLSQRLKRSLWRCSKTVLNTKFTDKDIIRHPPKKITRGNVGIFKSGRLKKKNKETTKSVIGLVII